MFFLSIQSCLSFEYIRIKSNFINENIFNLILLKLNQFCLYCSVNIASIEHCIELNRLNVSQKHVSTTSMN